MKKYLNRAEAGEILANSLQSYAHDPNLVLLALPRGGIPVAHPIAKLLSTPLDVIISRKLGVPGYDELAFGAITINGMVQFNHDVIHTFNLSQNIVNFTVRTEEKELLRREALYRSNRPYPNLNNKTVILVDDGIATGTTIKIILPLLKLSGASHIAIAAPVAAKETCNLLSPHVNAIICPWQPTNFHAVNDYYLDFTQLTDQEVYDILNEHHSYPSLTSHAHYDH